MDSNEKTFQSFKCTNSLCHSHEFDAVYKELYHVIFNPLQFVIDEQEDHDCEGPFDIVCNKCGADAEHVLMTVSEYEDWFGIEVPGYLKKAYIKPNPVVTPLFESLPYNSPFDGLLDGVDK